MRLLRDFRPGQLYGVTQRGNNGQWVYRDAEDFCKALDLMRLYAGRHEVRVHGWCLLHNHGHWVFEASTEDSISNLMRDMQGCYSRYLNKRYRDGPDLLLAPLEQGSRKQGDFTRFLRAGPVNWSPRFDAQHLDAKGFKEFLRYAENNPVRAGLKRRAVDWEWSSARAHCAGSDAAGLLCLELWQHGFGNPATAAGEWQVYLEGPVDEAVENAARGRRLGPHNRPTGWVRRLVARSAGALPG